MTVGFVAGVGSSYAVVRRARTIARRYAPPEVTERIAGNAAQLRREVSAAVAEGRQAMHRREAQLRAEVGRRSQ
jgi:hypothetical protein